LTKSEFKTLFHQHFDAVRNYIWYRSGDAELASDIAQEAFLKLWEKQDRLNNKNQKALLYKMAGDLFVSHYRKTKHELKFSLQTNARPAVRTPEDEMHFDELKQRYEQSLSQLPEKQRVVFLMSRMDQLKYSEIAQNLGLSQKAVEKRMNQALQHLRKALNA
jgi:RNA polymerase sigma-70 factor (family 1)